MNIVQYESWLFIVFFLLPSKILMCVTTSPPNLSFFPNFDDSDSFNSLLEKILGSKTIIIIIQKGCWSMIIPTLITKSNESFIFSNGLSSSVTTHLCRPIDQYTKSEYTFITDILYQFGSTTNSVKKNTIAFTIYFLIALYWIININ
jgi:hypothetical protein